MCAIELALAAPQRDDVNFSIPADTWGRRPGETERVGRREDDFCFDRQLAMIELQETRWRDLSSTVEVVVGGEAVVEKSVAVVVRVGEDVLLFPEEKKKNETTKAPEKGDKDSTSRSEANLFGEHGNAKKYTPEGESSKPIYYRQEQHAVASRKWRTDAIKRGLGRCFRGR